MEENRIVTRKDEVRFTTSDMRKALGKFLRKAVKKTYQEDFIDESTGETLTIDRHELLFKAGQQITQDLAARIQFSINAGDIAEIEVSNQHRQATAYAYDRLQPWKVTAGINRQHKSFLLQAQSAQKAIEVATDYIELNSIGAFNIVGVKSLGGVIVLDAPLRKVEKQTRARHAGTSRRAYRRRSPGVRSPEGGGWQQDARADNLLQHRSTNNILRLLTAEERRKRNEVLSTSFRRGDSLRSSYDVHQPPYREGTLRATRRPQRKRQNVYYSRYAVPY